MVSMLFPWHFSGIIWHPGRILWNAMECHGCYAISMAFQWNYMASRWNAMEFHGMPWTYIISMAFQWNSMAFQWNAMEFHGIQKIGTLTKLVTGSKQWNLANKMAANKKFKKSLKYLGGGIILHGLEYCHAMPRLPWKWSPWKWQWQWNPWNSMEISETD